MQKVPKDLRLLLLILSLRPRSARTLCAGPESYQALYKLELNKTVGPIKAALEPLHGNINLLTESLVALPEVEEWFLTCQSSFEKWAKAY